MKSYKIRGREVVVWSATVNGEESFRASLTVKTKDEKKHSLLLGEPKSTLEEALVEAEKSMDEVDLVVRFLEDEKRPGKPSAIDVSDETAQAVGHYLMSFAALEAALDEEIAKLISEDDLDVGAIVTAQTGITAKVNLFGALHKHRCKVLSEREYVDQVIHRCDQAIATRNRVVHASWGANKSFIRVVRAKAREGLRVELRDMTPKKLKEHTDELAELVKAVTEVSTTRFMKKLVEDALENT